MNRRTLSILVFSISATVITGSNLPAQNLVQNGSFEEYYKCPGNYTEKKVKKFLPFWNMPSKGTPDFFNTCSREMVGIPQNFMGNIHAFEGIAYVGLVILDSPLDVKKEINYREYIQTRIGTTLQRDSLYLIKFYYSVAAYSTFAVNRLGAYLSHGKVTPKKGVLNYKPQVYIDTSALYCTPGEWTQFCDTFRAHGGENYLTIGNFYKDSKTAFVKNDVSMSSIDLQRKIKINQVAYYYIDNISIQKVDRDTLVNEFGFIQKFRPLSRYKQNRIIEQTGDETIYLLDETYYNASGGTIPPVSFYQLNDIVDLLKENPSVSVTLTGLLSENENSTGPSMERAQLLSNRLTELGIEPERIKTNTLNVKVIPKSITLYQNGQQVELQANLVAIRLKNK